ncbi:MAG: hypothetical protein ABIL01_04635 [Pseudomonadota bacterium]
MTLSSNEAPAIDPDNIPETLCIGRFNVTFGPGPWATMTFTHHRNKVGPLMNEGQTIPESVVRARIVTTPENMVALRDLLNDLLKDHPASAAAAVAGSSGKPN